MTAKITVDKLYKIFGPQPEKALDLAQQDVGPEEILRRTNSVVAVNNVSFSVDEAQIFVVMGLSGSGKSTLIRCLNRLFEPTGGKVYLDDLNITAADATTLRKVRMGRMAMVFQHFALFPHMTVWENVAYGLKVRGMPLAERREKAIASLDAVGLDAWAESYPGNLSGGMQQRVGLARALAVDPEVLLMDEPFSALDPLIRRDMQDELLELQDRLGTTIVFITHDLQEALKLGDRIALMKNGNFVQVGTAQQIVTEPAEEYVLEFTRDVDRSRVLTFGDIMDKVRPVSATAAVSEIRSRFAAEKDAEALIVVDTGGKPVGFIEPDALNGADGSAAAVSIMNRRFAKVRRSNYLWEGFDRLGASQIIAVVDRAGKLAGALDPLRVFSHLKPVPHEHTETKEALQSPARSQKKEFV